MNSQISQLEQDLTERNDVCTSNGPIDEFPPSLYQPFHSFGIGVIVCERGSFDFKVDDEDYTAHAGDCVFLPNDKIFSATGHSEDMVIYVLVYQVDPIRDILGTTVTSMSLYTKFYPKRCPVYHTGKEEDLISYISLISATKNAQREAFNAYEQKLLLMSVTYNLCSIFQKKMNQTGTLHARRTEVFLNLIKLIDKYYMEERGVEFYADKLCLSSKYVSGLSKSICGYTVQELVFKAIIRKAKTMLDVTNKTVQEISNDFNFPNASSFGTFFKKHTGTSPQKYRETVEQLKHGEATR